MAIVDADRLSYEIFSILESKFLGFDDSKKLVFPASSAASPRAPTGAGRVRILSIDGGDSPSDSLLAAAALTRLESSLCLRSGDPSARIADFFDVAAGSGSGGVLAALLFTKGYDGRPLFSAADALRLLFAESRRRVGGFSARRGLFRGIFRRSGGLFRRIFGEWTLRDTVKPVLIPCYDLATGAPFVFSRADAVEADAYDFRIREVCAATCADAGAAAVELRSVDGRTRVAAVGGGVVLANPAAVAITHVLHNRQEFPFAVGVEDLLLVSLGAGGSAPALGAADLVRIAGEGVSDMANGFASGNCNPRTRRSSSRSMEAAEELLLQRNVESLLFRGKKISEHTNAEKLEWLAGELIQEDERRRKCPIPTVIPKHAMTPRTSSATTITTVTTESTGSSTSTICCIEGCADNKEIAEELSWKLSLDSSSGLT
ncbi:hypothetical protein BHE74_00012566 [Ensete ventricosum]|nr:hypothetical protein GW17_00045583 [Ensete ventricosum]RWW79154.1 hypothetical protein BHE74_00012566 [Ensete ventricosum]RZS21094.1 hypothetical protein BHM03_00053692 [Ensete ventricosum]